MATNGPSRILLPALSCTLTVFTLAGPSPATGQRLAPDPFTSVAHPSASLLAPPQAAPTPSAGHLIVGACLGSLVGLFAGSGLGYALGGEGWDMLGFVGGTVVGSAVGVKLAAKSDGRHTTFASALKAGLLGTAAGVAAGVALGAAIDPGVGVLGFYFTQGAVTGLWAHSHMPR